MPRHEATARIYTDLGHVEISSQKILPGRESDYHWFRITLRTQKESLEMEVPAHDMRHLMIMLASMLATEDREDA